jgi:exonuclease III
MGDFNTQFSPIDRSPRHKLKREIIEQTDMKQMNLTDIYRTFHTNTKEYTIFTTPHKTFSKLTTYWVTGKSQHIQEN